MPKNKKLSPLVVARQEGQRRAIVQELSLIKEKYGFEVVANILEASSSIQYVHAVRRDRLRGSMYTFLEAMGVTLNVVGRKVTVSDLSGTFNFIDDAYYSGLHYVLKPFVNYFEFDIAFMVPTRSPNSLQKYIQETGFWEPESPTESARNFLVYLHETGGYDMTKLVYKLQGGEYTSLRKIVHIYRPPKPVKTVVQQQDATFHTEITTIRPRNSRSKRNGGIDKTKICPAIGIITERRLKEHEFIQFGVDYANKGLSHELVTSLGNRSDANYVRKYSKYLGVDKPYIDCLYMFYDYTEAYSIEWDVALGAFMRLREFWKKKIKENVLTSLARSTELM